MTLGRSSATIVSALIAALAVCTAGDFSDSQFAGLDGRGIAARLHQSWPTPSYDRPILGPDGTWATVQRYASSPDGTITDLFSGISVTTLPDASMPPEGFVLASLIDPGWWHSPQASELWATADLINLWPMQADEADAMRDRIPWTVDRPTRDNSIWQSGITLFDQVEVATYRPPAKVQGDIARIIMYNAVMRPAAMWAAPAYLLMADGDYPLLTSAGAAVMMQWHRDDPVDDFELLRDKVITDAQGCGNPFVQMPWISEYIWGDHAGQIVEPDGEATQPLRANYSIAADRTLWLESPYIPIDASWAIDGAPVLDTKIDLTSIGCGLHTLSYQCTDCAGVLKIMVTQ